MATKKKSTTKRGPKKAAPDKKAKASAKKPRLQLDDLKYSSGKIDDDTLSKIKELEEVLGVHEVNHFGTNDTNIFENQLKEMTLADLQNLCGKVRLFASGNTRELKEKLRNEFKRVSRGQRTISMRQGASICDPNHPDHEKAKKILGQGF
jgi:hypothetical protein|tara:strand:+ start:30 stop:479 length:450 start_codon:yes stop_codon:yes gene_type:complete